MSEVFRLEETQASWAGLGAAAQASSPVRAPIRGDEILDLLAARAGETLLDLGCSRHHLISCGLRRELATFGLDYTAEAAAVSKRSDPESMIVVGTVPDIPFEPAAFDLVTCLNLPPALANPADLLGEIYRVLKCGGRACLLLPNAYYRRRSAGAEEPAYPVAEPALSREEWERFLWSSGLIVYQQYSDWVLEREKPAISSPDWWRRTRRFCRRYFGAWLPAIFTSQFAFFCRKE